MDRLLEDHLAYKIPDNVSSILQCHWLSENSLASIHPTLFIQTSSKFESGENSKFVIWSLKVKVFKVALLSAFFILLLINI